MLRPRRAVPLPLLLFVLLDPFILSVYLGDLVALLDFVHLARHLIRAAAMPLIVGPGTISASVFAGSRLDPGPAAGAILLALVAAIAAILLFKRARDYVRTHNERVIASYSEVAGRITALFTGSFAIERILNGIDGWLRALETAAG